MPVDQFMNFGVFYCAQISGLALDVCPVCWTITPDAYMVPFPFFGYDVCLSCADEVSGILRADHAELLYDSAKPVHL